MSTALFRTSDLERFDTRGPKRDVTPMRPNDYYNKLQDSTMFCAEFHTNESKCHSSAAVRIYWYFVNGVSCLRKYVVLTEIRSLRDGVRARRLITVDRNYYFRFDNPTIAQTHDAHNQAGTHRRVEIITTRVAVRRPTDTEIRRDRLIPYKKYHEPGTPKRTPMFFMPTKVFVIDLWLHRGFWNLSTCTGTIIIVSGTWQVYAYSCVEAEVARIIYCIRRHNECVSAGNTNDYGVIKNHLTGKVTRVSS